MQLYKWANRFAFLLLLISFKAQVYSENAPRDTSFFQSTICPSQAFFIAGTVFDAQNLAGFVVLPGASWDGTDSVVVVNLTLAPPVTNTIAASFCSNEALFINGQIYDASNPSGTELLPGAAAGGCDSLIVVNLTFLSPASFLLQQTICTNDTVWVNNQAYDQYYYLGMETITGGAANGCDSVIVVDLTVLPAPSDTLSQTLCPGESITVNGTIYNQGRPLGTETLANAAVNGCDSLVYITLLFSPDISNPSFLGADRQVSVGDSICITLPNDLNSQQVNWGNNLPCVDPSCMAVCITPTTQQLLICTITDDNQCTFTDSVLVSVSINRKVYVPNVFSSEAAAPNNRFTISSGTNGTRINWMRIYDRWGGLVYSEQNFMPEDTDKSWDGMTRGKMAQSDVYTYAIELLYLDGETEVRSGTVTFLR